jgi:Tol biopolymer transport system component/DNA-binding winged helix-turn-helix (wHTH) protein
MNEPFPALHRRIDPALEPPFSLGRLRVSPATLELSLDGSAETIEMRMMQVLIALHQRVGQAVSRDELSELCWEGRIVGDDALNRVISRLRKALSADPAIAIDTIPKVGYRLKVEGADGAVPPSPRPRRYWPLIAGGAALLLLAIAALVLWNGREVRWSAETMRPLTRDPGIEIFPALSPDGRQLAYAQGPGFGAATDIYLRGTALGETRPARLTATPSTELSPSWSPDGARLAFVRYEEGRLCEIVVISPPSSAERIAGRCREAPLTMIDWLDERTILYSDGPREGPWRLFALDVGSGKARPLTTPGGRILGDSAPIVAPDGRRIAFRRTVTPGNDDIFLLDRSSGAVQPLGIGGWKAIGFAWGADSRTLFLTSNRGGDFGLWTVDTRRASAPQRISYGILGLGQMSADANGNLAIETIRTRTNLFAFSADGKASPLTTADGNDWEPDVAGDGSIAFGSDVSGSTELWVKRPGEEPVRLTQLRGSYVYSPRWSSDGRRIAFIGVDQGRNEVYVIDADGSRLRKLTDDGINKGHLVWAGAGASELLYTAEPAGGWRVMRLGAGGPARPVPGSEGLVILRSAPDGALFGRGLAPPILRLAYRAGRMARVPTGVSVPIAEAWTPARDGIYWVDGRNQGPANILFTPWGGRTRTFGGLQAIHRPALALRPADGAVVAPRLTEESADLILFELKKN